MAWANLIERIQNEMSHKKSEQNGVYRNVFIVCICMWILREMKVLRKDLDF